MRQPSELDAHPLTTDEQILQEYEKELLDLPTPDLGEVALHVTVFEGASIDANTLTEMGADTSYTTQLGDKSWPDLKDDE